MKHSLAAKFLGLVGSLLLVSLAAVAFFAERAVRGPLTGTLRTKGETLIGSLSTSVREALLVGDELLVGTYVDQAGRRPGVLYVYVTDPTGLVIAHSDMLVAKGTRLEESPAPPPAGQVAAIERVFASGRAYELTVAVAGGGRTLATVRLGLSPAEVERALADVRLRLIVLSAATLALALLGAFVLARWLSAPIARLTRVTEEIAAGRLDVAIEDRSRDEVGLLADSLRHMTDQLKARRDELVQRRQLHDELELAARIQQTLLPRETPYLEGFEVAAHYVPAKEVSGDYFDIFWVDDDRLGIAVADVCGKGVPAALLMVTCRAELRYLARAERSPATVLRKLNRTLSPTTERGRMFVTLLYAVLDLRLRLLTFANAGHTPLLLVPAGSEQVQPFESHSLPMGSDYLELFEGQIRDEHLSLRPSDLVFFYTDGLSELGRPAGPPDWDEQTVYRLVAAHAREPVATLLRLLQAEADRALAGAPYTDDLTMVGIKAK